MSAAASSSKSTTANTILYKRVKDVPRLPTFEKSDPRRTLDGFKAVPGFSKRRDLTKNEEWEGYCYVLVQNTPGNQRGIGSILDRYDNLEHEPLVKGYWRAYDMEHNELEALFFSLMRKEATETESKRKSEEGKKKKSKPAAPIASGSGSGKGKEKAKEKESETDDSDSEPDLLFWESCVGCERAKVRCVFTHATTGKKVACDRCICRKINCTYRSPKDFIIQRMLKKVSKTLVNLDVEAGNRNHLEAEWLYCGCHQQMLDGLQRSIDQLMKADELGLGLLILETQYKDGTSVPEDL
ncbi:hypothetical protein M422DRAFT_242890 [Sphaerobolus stellatus SS14]|nr:hypothetical protein M422DRAFT_242890 [Sphaerobolus stellatus SS14]